MLAVGDNVMLDGNVNFMDVFDPERRVSGHPAAQELRANSHIQDRLACGID